MRRPLVTLSLVACSLSSLSFACSGSESPPSGTGASSGSGGAGNAPSSGGSSGSAAAGGTTASGGSDPTGGSGATSGATSTGGASGTGNAGDGAGATGGSAGATGGSGGATAGTAGVPAVDDGCALAPLGPVTFSVPSGTFQGMVSVELTTAEAGAEIRYTTDHTPPTATSTLYAGALSFTQTTELRAQAFAQGAPVGGPQTAVYVARAVDATHDLPVMILDSYGVEVPGQNTGGSGPGFPGTGGMEAREYIDAAVMTFEPAGGVASLASPPTIATPAGFHIRGQSSASYDKKPYRVELRDATSSDRNCVLLGMPSESDWVLHSPFPDKALIRNAFVYSLGAELGMPAPRGKFAEVYLNTAARPLEAGDYQGVYLLVETIKNQKDRLNLQQLEPTDTMLPALTGGYIFKFEWRVMDIEQTLTCPAGDYCWNYLEVADPKPWVQEQHDYLAGYLRQLVDALHSAAPADPATGYPAFLDTASFVNQVIVHELTRNLDAYTRSQFFHKERDGKVVAGPLWDYDLIAGVGTSGNTENLSLEGFQYESSAMRFTDTADWFPILLAEPTFHAALVTRWKELRLTLLSDAQITARIDGLAAGLAAGAGRNFTKWPILTTERIGFFETPVVETWEGQVAAMRDWLLGRAAWLDTQWI
jgi:hypothetical protein